MNLKATVSKPSTDLFSVTGDVSFTVPVNLDELTEATVGQVEGDLAKLKAAADILTKAVDEAVNRQIAYAVGQEVQGLTS